jgi:hypothetical protein
MQRAERAAFQTLFWINYKSRKVICYCASIGPSLRGIKRVQGFLVVDVAVRGERECRTCNQSYLCAWGVFRCKASCLAHFCIQSVPGLGLDLDVIYVHESWVHKRWQG